MPFQKIGRMFLRRGTAKNGRVFYHGSAFLNLEGSKKKVYLTIWKMKEPRFDAELYADIAYLAKEPKKQTDASALKKNLTVEEDSDRFDDEVPF